MKKTNKIIAAGLITTLVLSSVGTMLAYGGNGNSGGCKGDTVCMKERRALKGNHNERQGKNMNENLDKNTKTHHDDDQKLDEIKNSELQVMTESDKEYIAHMREEEKIARDVYITLYQKWGIRSFDNISKSETKHMDAVKILIDKYGLEDSMKSNEVGVFNDPEFQKLYDDLVAKGTQSKLDAIQVGLTIEDLDIYDLEKFMEETENSDIKSVFTNLNNGSMNHMRAFNRQLEKESGDYTAQFITEDRMKEILAGKNMNHEEGNSGQKGQGGKGYGSHEVGNSENIDMQVKDMDNQETGFFMMIWNWIAFWK